MLITVSGPPGVGKTTFASALAERLGYAHVSGGDLFRSLAAERDCSLAEFNALAEADESIDRDLDRRLRETARERDDVILESRLSGWMAGAHANIRVWLDAPFDVRVARIAEREGEPVERVREQTEEREASEKRRYREYYGIDFEDTSIYDLAVNTARWDVEGEVAIVVSAIDAYDPEADEGGVDVEARYEF